MQQSVDQNLVDQLRTSVKGGLKNSNYQSSKLDNYQNSVKIQNPKKTQNNNDIKAILKKYNFKKLVTSSIEKTNKKEKKQQRYKNFVNNMRKNILDDINKVNNNSNTLININSNTLIKKSNNSNKNIFGKYLCQIINKSNIVSTLNSSDNNIVDNKGNRLCNECYFYISGIKINNDNGNKITELEAIINNLKNQIFNLQTIINNLTQESNYYKNEFEKISKNNVNSINNNKNNIKVFTNVNNNTINNVNNNFNNIIKNLNKNIKTTEEITNNINKNDQFINKVKSAEINKNDTINKNINNENIINNNTNKIIVNKKYGNIDNNANNQRKEQKMTNAMKRLRRQAKSVDVEGKEELFKSEKISSFAKLLEVQLNKNGGMAVQAKNEEVGIVKQNEDIINMIENKPIEHKKKKKRAGSFEE